MVSPRYPRSEEELAANIKQSNLPGYARVLLLANYGNGPDMDKSLQTVLALKSQQEREAVTAEIFRVLGLTEIPKPNFSEDL